MDILTIIGDSLSIVRPDDGITEKDLYSYKIQEKLKDSIYVINKGKKGNTSKLVNSMESIVYNVKSASSKFFIVHIGICDCAPRLFTMKEKKILNFFLETKNLSILARMMIRWKSSHRYVITKKKYIPEVSISEFKTNIMSLLNMIVSFNEIKKIFLLNIAYPGNSMVEKSYGIQNHILNYNEVLKEMVTKYNDKIEIIDVYSLTKNNLNFLLSDGYHLSKECHSEIAKNIISLIHIES